MHFLYDTIDMQIIIIIIIIVIIIIGKCAMSVHIETLPYQPWSDGKGKK